MPRSKRTKTRPVSPITNYVYIIIGGFRIGEQQRCVADDLYLSSILDRHLKFKTHRNHTPLFDIKKSEEKILKKQLEIYRTIVRTSLPFTIKRHYRFNEVNGARVEAKRYISCGAEHGYELGKIPQNYFWVGQVGGWVFNNK